jgi:hypothetical protein
MPVPKLKALVEIEVLRDSMPFRYLILSDEHIQSQHHKPPNLANLLSDRNRGHFSVQGALSCYLKLNRQHLDFLFPLNCALCKRLFPILPCVVKSS